MKTKKLLLEMDRLNTNKSLKKLFEDADLIMPDLIRALDDTHEMTSVRAQIIITYLAEPASLKALDDWCAKRPKCANQKPNNRPGPQLLAETYLKKYKSDPESAVSNNRNMFECIKSSYEFSIKLVAYNERQKTALLQLTDRNGEKLLAQSLTAIRRSGERWQLLFENIIWRQNSSR